MKIVIAILAGFLTLVSNAQNFEVRGKDTINFTDADGRKQGKWVLFGHNKPGKCNQPDQKIEEGRYKDNKRIGVWKEYHCNNNVKSSVTYVNGHPEGPTAMYYDNGTVKEEGTWKQNRWVGAYKAIDESGNITEIVFDEKGKEVSKKMTPVKRRNRFFFLFFINCEDEKSSRYCFNFYSGFAFISNSGQHSKNSHVDH